MLRRYREALPPHRRSLSTTSSRLRAAYERGEVDLCLTTELDRPTGSELLFSDPLAASGRPAISPG